MGYKCQRSGFGYGTIRRAQKFHARRSNRAKLIDEGLRAPIAKNPEQWMQQPNRFDIPDVDTPKKTKELFGENADNACLDHIRLDELERGRKGIRQRGLFKEPSFVPAKEVVFTNPIEEPQKLGWVKSDKGISWE